MSTRTIGQGIGACWGMAGRFAAAGRRTVMELAGVLVLLLAAPPLARPGVAQDVGAAYQLAGPRVAANAQDRWVLVMGDRILVITNDGRVFAHDVGTAIRPAYQLTAPPVASRPEDRWVLAMGNRIIVITAAGRVFAHEVNGRTVGAAYQLSGPRVASNPQDRRVLGMGNRIAVITEAGDVFVHGITERTIGSASRLAGPRVAANPQDAWVLATSRPGGGHRVLVITRDGRVFAHNISADAVGNAYPLPGPRVAANPEDRWVIGMRNRNSSDPTFFNRIGVITRDGRLFVHNLSVPID